MASRKRAHPSYSSEDEALISLKVADVEAAPLTAKRVVLAAVSSCVHGLPEDAAEWDLSQLLIEGQPVGRDVVVAWLDAVHMIMYQEHFQAEQRQEPPLAVTAARVAKLLVFADAVGTIKGALAACLPQLDQLQFCIKAGKQQLQLSAAAAYWWDRKTLLQLYMEAPDKPEESVLLLHTQQQKTQLMQQFTTQLEVLLYLAHKLQLPRLTDVVHHTVRLNSSFGTSLLRAPSDLAAVVSERVLQEAAGPSQHSRMAFINSLRTQPAAFVAGTRMHQLFKPVGLTQAQKKPIRFRAELTDDVMATGSKGQVVDVELDLFNTSSIKVGTDPLPVQLLIGPLLSQQAAAPVLHATRNTA